jgi:5-methylcytosine-specific restriction protein A
MPQRPPQHTVLWHRTRAERERLRQIDNDALRATAKQRGYDVAWRKLRGRYLKTNPWCTAPGCQRRATDVDHVHSIRERPDLRLAWSNLRALCHPCHSRRTATEQGFARPASPTRPG